MREQDEVAKPRFVAFLTYRYGNVFEMNQILNTTFVSHFGKSRFTCGISIGGRFLDGLNKHHQLHQIFLSMNLL